MTLKPKSRDTPPPPPHPFSQLGALSAAHSALSLLDAQATLTQDSHGVGSSGKEDCTKNNSLDDMPVMALLLVHGFQPITQEWTFLWSQFTEQLLFIRKE